MHSIFLSADTDTDNAEILADIDKLFPISAKPMYWLIPIYWPITIPILYQSYTDIQLLHTITKIKSLYDLHLHQPQTAILIRTKKGKKAFAQRNKPKYQVDMRYDLQCIMYCSDCSTWYSIWCMYMSFMNLFRLLLYIQNSTKTGKYTKDIVFY